MPRDDCQAGYEDHSERELDSANEVFSKPCSGSRPVVFDSAARSRSAPLRDRQSLESRLTITHDVIADNLWSRSQFGPNVPIPNFASTCDMPSANLWLWFRTPHYEFAAQQCGGPNQTHIKVRF